MWIRSTGLMTRSWERYKQDVFIVCSLHLSPLFALLCQRMLRWVRKDFDSVLNRQKLSGFWASYIIQCLICLLGSSECLSMLNFLMCLRLQHVQYIEYLGGSTCFHISEEFELKLIYLDGINYKREGSQVTNWILKYLFSTLYSKATSNFRVDVHWM